MIFFLKKAITNGLINYFTFNLLWSKIN